MRIEPVTGGELVASLKLLEASLRNGEPVARSFVVAFEEAVARGDLAVLAAYEGAEAVGVLVLSYRLSIAAGSRFASIEELYVEPEARGRRIGKTLVEVAGELCRSRGVSYVEVQAVDEAATFYAAAGYEEEDGMRVMSRSYTL